MWFGDGIRGASVMAGFLFLLGQIFLSFPFNVVCKLSTPIILSFWVRSFAWRRKSSIDF
jgi:hypothetical protein